MNVTGWVGVGLLQRTVKIASPLASLALGRLWVALPATIFTPAPGLLSVPLLALRLKPAFSPFGVVTVTVRSRAVAPVATVEIVTTGAMPPPWQSLQPPLGTTATPPLLASATPLAKSATTAHSDRAEIEEIEGMKDSTVGALLSPAQRSVSVERLRSNWFCRRPYSESGAVSVNSTVRSLAGTT